MVPPYNDARVMAGQGTIALELLYQVHYHHHYYYVILFTHVGVGALRGLRLGLAAEA
jgi:threonine dehydratase